MDDKKNQQSDLDKDILMSTEGGSVLPADHDQNEKSAETEAARIPAESEAMPEADTSQDSEDALSLAKNACQKQAEAAMSAACPLEEETEKFELMEIDQPEEKSEDQLMDEKAAKVIAGFTASAAATCALPIPFADAPLLVGQQVGMMASLCGIYHINMKKKALQSLVLAVLGVSGTTILGKSLFTSLIKMIPGAGSVAGGAVAAATGGSLTAALGKAWQLLCKDVLSGKLSADELHGKEGIKLLTTALNEQLRLEMHEKEEEADVLKEMNIPEDEAVIVPKATQNDPDQADLPKAADLPEEEAGPDPEAEQEDETVIELPTSLSEPESESSQPAHIRLSRTERFAAVREAAKQNDSSEQE